MEWAFSKLAKAKARGQSPQERHLNSETFNTLLGNSSLEGLLEICENLNEHFTKVKRSNLDKKYAVLTAFSLISN